MKDWALRVAATAAILTISAAPQACAHDRAAITRELGRIKTATGETALERIKSCGIRPDWSGSWMEFVPGRGDILQLDIAVPSPDGGLDRDLTARWKIVRGRAVPDTGWAQNIQNHPYPIGSATWMRC